MAVLLKDLLEDPKLREKFFAPRSIGDCGVCGEPIMDEHPDEVRMITADGKKKPVHEDCYYDELGKLVEEHPITSPRIRRG